MVNHEGKKMDYKSLLKYAYEIATKSHDNSTQNGAILVDDNSNIITTGCNEFPYGVQRLDERHERPIKYKFTEHAERNVIYKAAMLGYLTNGSTMVCPWAACSDCGRAIIQSGIKRLVTHKQAHDRSPPFWAKEIDVAFTMLKEAGIEIVMFDGNVGGVEILHCGERWSG